MGIAERKEREKQKRRKDIIDAAERIFFSKGRATATMDDVAEEAELSKGTLYLYFKNKEDLYLAIHLRGLLILESMFKDACANVKMGIDQVVAIGNAYLNFYKEYPDYFKAIVYYESHDIDLKKSSCGADCEAQGERTISILIEAIQTGIEDGTIRSNLDPFKTAVILWGYTTGLIQIISIKGDHLQKEHGQDVEELINYSFKMLRYSLSS